MKAIKFLLFFIISFNLLAQDEGLTLIAVGDAGLEVEKISFSPAEVIEPLSFNQKKAINSLMKIFVNDFKFYRKRFKVDGIEGVGSGSSQMVDTPSYGLWSGRKTKYLIRNKIKAIGEDLDIQSEVHNIEEKKRIFSRHLLIPLGSLRERGHELADAWFQAITGKESIFKSKIVFVSDRTGPRNDPYKELYIMDFDGFNKKQLTFHRATVISPSISYDKSKILYSVIKRTKKRKNVDLYMYDLTTNKTSMVSRYKGINSGAVFMPGDQKILLTLTFKGSNADIFEMDLRSKRLRRVTRLSSTDVDPSISFDGNLMTFLSDRPGKAMIYTADPRGSEKMVKRISFVGQFNATPRFSPDGKVIAFSSWVDNRFDIFTIGSDGTGLSRLTKNFGSNEDPTFSSDGEFIAFSSQRVLSKKSATHEIYIMDKEGDILGAITSKYGKCVSPRWSK